MRRMNNLMAGVLLASAAAGMAVAPTTVAVEPRQTGKTNAVLGKRGPEKRKDEMRRYHAGNYGRRGSKLARRLRRKAQLGMRGAF